MKKIIDVSQPLNSRLAVWPGDEPFRWSRTAALREGHSVNLGALAMSAHAGTHADAPFHVAGDGATVEQLPLGAFMGAARVVQIPSAAAAVWPEHVSEHVASLKEGEPERVLFKTRASRVPAEQWNEDFPAVHPDTVEMLAGAGVVLIGTDAPSVDPAESEALPAHHALMRHGIVNLENLALGGVEPGRYFLIALPLRLEGADASPVRAVLLPAEERAA